MDTELAVIDRDGKLQNDGLFTVLNKLIENVNDLERRISVLESGQISRPVAVDELREEIISFLLKNPGMKFDARSIAGNLKREGDVKKISDRLLTLRRNRLVSGSDDTQRNVLYWIDAGE